MKDETFAFVEDVKNRKSMARGALHKKSGSKSKKCTLPSDYLTKKEIEKMNGPVCNYNMNAFFTVEEFKKMPKSIQEEYLNHVGQKYNVGIYVISTTLFERSRNWLDEYIDAHKLEVEHHGVRGVGARVWNAEFAKAIREARGETDVVTVEETYAAPGGARITSNKNENTVEMLPITMDHVELVMQNGLDYVLLDQIYQRFDGKCKFTILIEKIT